MHAYIGNFSDDSDIDEIQSWQKSPNLSNRRFQFSPKPHLFSVGYVKFLVLKKYFDMLLLRTYFEHFLKKLDSIFCIMILSPIPYVLSWHSGEYEQYCSQEYVSDVNVKVVYVPKSCTRVGMLYFWISSSPRPTLQQMSSHEYSRGLRRL